MKQTVCKFLSVPAKVKWVWFGIQILLTYLFTYLLTYLLNLLAPVVQWLACLFASVSDGVVLTCSYIWNNCAGDVSLLK